MGFRVLLCFLTISVFARATWSTVTCKGPVGVLAGGALFEEGIDDYLIILRATNLPNSFISKFVPVDNLPYSLEFRVPKMVGDKPGCFLDPSLALLFTCLKTAPVAKAILTNEKTYETLTVDVKSVSIEASSITRKYVEYGRDVSNASFKWGFGIETADAVVRDVLSFNGEQCRSEAP